jgi:hypothetical protein
MSDNYLEEQLWMMAAPMAAVLFFVFRRKVFGVLDPLAWFLLCRIVPLLTCVIVLLRSGNLNIYGTLLLLSAAMFVLSLLHSTPAAIAVKLVVTEASCRKLGFLAAFIFILKFALLSSVYGELPIFSEGGSDAYINFDLDNKLSSSILLGIGSSDLVILSFLFPLEKRGLNKFIIFFAVILSIVVTAASGKKSSILSALLAVALGEYLRLYLVEHQRRFFLTAGKITFALSASIFWAVWIYTNTVSGRVDLNVGAALNFAVFQWAYPFLIFTSGDLTSFFQGYEVNRITYLFHSLLSPLGFPAFSASIGPSLHEYQTGQLSGNGINPTFVIEGYVLAGSMMPLYAALVAYVIGRGRALFLQSGSLFRRVALSAVLLSPLYNMAIDMLLFMKVLFVVVGLLIFSSFCRQLLVTCK